jgi:hypothetical protein
MRERGAHLARPVTKLGHLLLIARELAVQLLDLDLDRPYPRVCLAMCGRSELYASLGARRAPTR